MLYKHYTNRSVNYTRLKYKQEQRHRHWVYIATYKL